MGLTPFGCGGGYSRSGGHEKMECNQREPSAGHTVMVVETLK